MKEAREWSIAAKDDSYAAPTPGKRPVHDGTFAAHRALMGIATCASCGRTLKVAASGPQRARARRRTTVATTGRAASRRVAFIKSGSALDYGEDFPRLIRARRKALDQARDRRFELMDDVEAFGYLPPLASWDDVPVKQKRRIAAQVLGSVEVSKSSNRRWQPIAERVTVP